MAEYAGKLKDISALELGAIASRAAMERTGVKPDAIDHVVFGNVLQTSADAVYGARHVGLKAGLPIEVPALTVNRLCGSGIQAAVSGGQMILLGEADVVLTGGMENMTQAPHVIRGLRSGLRLGQGQLEDTLWSALLDTHCGCTMAGTAENCAAKYGDLARRAGSATPSAASSSPTRRGRKGASRTKSSRSRSSPAKASKSSRRTTTCVPIRRWKGWRSCRRPSARTAVSPPGTPPGIVDGGAALLLASEAGVKKHGLTPLARLTHWATVGVEPTLMGMGPSPATRLVLEKAEPHAERHRSDRSQRGVRGAVPVGREGSRPRSRSRQRQRRRHRARASAGDDRDATAPYADAGTATARFEARPRHRLHRRRSGHRGDRRNVLTCDVRRATCDVRRATCRHVWLRRSHVST